ELLDNRLRELPALRGEGDDGVRRRGAVDGVERRRDDVDPQHHPGAATVGLVVDLPGAERRVVAVREEAEVELVPEDGRHRPLLGEPRERVRDEREDVELHQSTNPAATRIRRASRSISRTQSSTIGSRTPVSSSSTSFATPGSTDSTTPSVR